MMPDFLKNLKPSVPKGKGKGKDPEAMREAEEACAELARSGQRLSRELVARRRQAEAFGLRREALEKDSGGTTCLAPRV